MRLTLLLELLQTYASACFLQNKNKTKQNTAVEVNYIKIKPSIIEQTKIVHCI